MKNKGTNFNFQKMTPTKVDEMHGYNESLDFVLNDHEILNIAVTGSYGAGKTSVIRTYEENRNQKFMYISLAEFENIQNNEQENGGEIEEDVSDETTGSVKLEGKIINQIIHQISPENIPQTEFRTRTDIPKKLINRMYRYSALFLMLIIYIFNFNYWGDIVSHLNEGFWLSTLQFTTSYISLIIAILLSIVMLLVFLYKLNKKLLNGMFFKKIKLLNNEIELFDKKNDSYFDKHLEEIIYIFKKSNYKVIVFEDIDRFNNNNIFIRLREINTIINANIRSENPKQEDYKKELIRFMYLLKDEMFDSNDRTKFFDFILPIVPVIDASNSFNELKDMMETGDIYNDFDHVFLERVCGYIDDMRVLKNIYNEYLIYRTRLMKPSQGVFDDGNINSKRQGLKLDSNRLFAMIVYKNIFSEDFSQLKLKKGFVYRVIENKDKLIEKETEKHKKRLKEIKDDIKNIQNESLKSIDELDALYFNYAHSIKVGEKHENSFQNRIAFIRAIKDNDYEVKIENRNGYMHGYNSDTIDEEFTKLEDNPEYYSRKESIDSRENNGVKQLHEEADKLKEEQRRIQGYRLADLLDTDNIDVYLGKKSSGIKDEKYYKLTRYLIRNGYINEDYQDYLTYFIPNNLTHNDKEYLLGVSDEISKEFSYNLDNPGLVISKLEPYDFMKEVILNYSLLTHLLETEHKYLHEMIKYIKNNYRFDFIFGYIEKIDESNPFIHELNKLWPGIIYDMNSSEIDWERIKPYLLRTLLLSTPEQLVEMNEENILTQLISVDKSFLEIDAPDIDKLMSAFKLWKVKFMNIDYEKSNKELFDSVYSLDFYELNKINLKQMMRVQLAVNEAKFKYKNYTCLVSHQDEPIFNYVENNINSYMEIIVDVEKIKDEEAVALKIINHENIQKENKYKYINLLSTTISKVEKVEDTDIIIKLFKQQKVRGNVKNIIEYYNQIGEIDSTLIHFINEVKVNLNTEYKNYLDSQTVQFLIRFVDELMEINDLNIDKLAEIVVHIGEKYDSISFKEVSPDKIDILIDNDLIILNEKTLKQIRDHYPTNLMSFIERNIEEYMELLEDEKLTEDELVTVVKDAQISDIKKEKLLQYVKQPISITDEYSIGYSGELKVYILENNYDENDFEELIGNFNSYSLKIQEVIMKIVMKNFEKLLESRISIDKMLLDQLFKSIKIDVEDKNDLYFHYYDTFSLEETKQYLGFCELTEFKRLLDGKRPRFAINTDNENILMYFLSKDWIASYRKKEDDNGNEMYFAYGKIKQAIQH